MPNPTQPKPPASEVLTALAMEVAEQGRWCHGETSPTDERGCLLWHLSKIVGVRFNSITGLLSYYELSKLPETRYLALATGREFEDYEPENAVITFNDRRTQVACVDLAHRAAVLAKEAESRGEPVQP